MCFTVTNDLTYDQRMIRICTALSNAGYHVTLIGRQLPNSTALTNQPFHQKRLNVLFKKGFLFYAAYNIRLFFYLLFKKTDGICAIDLDTILPCLVVSILRKKQRIYDAHELFCEMKEIQSRPRIHAIWKCIEKLSVPPFKYGYSVNHFITAEFKRMYGVDYSVIRNMPYRNEIPPTTQKQPFILYQGAVNEGRCFETLIPAMQWVEIPLWIVGSGNFMDRAQQLVQQYHLNDKVRFLGLVPPDELKNITPLAQLGFTLFEPDAESNYYSLANRFFDYIQAGTPQICVDYPAYREVNAQFEVALLIEDISSPSLAQHINSLLHSPEKLLAMQRACMEAARVLNWENESQKLIQFYSKVFG